MPPISGPNGLPPRPALGGAVPKAPSAGAPSAAEHQAPLPTPLPAHPRLPGRGQGNEVQQPLTAARPRVAEPTPLDERLGQLELEGGWGLSGPVVSREDFLAHCPDPSPMGEAACRALGGAFAD